jgi:hypothetical protein
VWLAEPRTRLRPLAELADQLEGAPGGQLVGKLWTAAQHGEPRLRGMVGGLAASPLPLPCAALSAL